MAGISRDTLRQRQSLPLECKVLMTKSRIREWYEHYCGCVYVSFSGGKDSTVLADIVKGMYKDVPLVYCDTGLENPSARRFAIDRSDKVIKPKMGFRDVIAKYGFPFPSKEQAQYIREARHGSDALRKKRMGDGNFSISKRWRFLVNAPFEVSEECCRVMKKEPFKRYERASHNRPMVATLAEESSLRTQQYLSHGCNAFDKTRAISTPLGFWTQNDILRYLKENDVEYASCYGDIAEDEDGNLHTTGVERTGCMFCMFGVDREKSPNRFEMMRETNPNMYRFCMNELGIEQVLMYCGIPY